MLEELYSYSKRLIKHLQPIFSFRYPVVFILRPDGLLIDAVNVSGAALPQFTARDFEYV